MLQAHATACCELHGHLVHLRHVPVLSDFVFGKYYQECRELHGHLFNLWHWPCFVKPTW